MSALDPILAYKADEVAALKASVSQGELDARARSAPAPRGFAAGLTAIAKTDQNALICELKRKSPSAGEILPGANPVAIARQYEAGGAACLSILTDAPSFGGTLSDLEAIREAVSLPLLRKDFMVDPLQVIEARAFGADAVLIIMAAVDNALAADLAAAADAYDMDAIVEVHDRGELDRALDLPCALLGINNRDLTRMTTDLAVTEALAAHVPDGRDLISESGISQCGDIARLRPTGARRFLIGESLMKRDDRKDAVHSLRHKMGI